MTMMMRIQQSQSEESVESSDSNTCNKKPKAKRKRGTKGKAGRPKGSKNKTPQKKPKQSAEPKKRMNFTKLEDENICKAWKSISQHPVIGANQTGTDFWGKIKEAFESLMLEFLDDKIIMVPCTQQTILDCFQRRISRDTKKFNACYTIRK